MIMMSLSSQGQTRRPVTGAAEAGTWRPEVNEIICSPDCHATNELTALTGGRRERAVADFKAPFL
jgi:hypothetical protein